MLWSKPVIPVCSHQIHGNPVFISPKCAARGVDPVDPYPKGFPKSQPAGIYFDITSLLTKCGHVCLPTYFCNLDIGRKIPMQNVHENMGGVLKCKLIQVRKTAKKYFNDANLKKMLK